MRLACEMSTLLKHVGRRCLSVTCRPEPAPRLAPIYSEMCTISSDAKTTPHVSDHTPRDALLNVSKIGIRGVTIQHVRKSLPVALPLKVSGHVGVVIDAIVKLLWPFEQIFASADPV